MNNSVKENQLMLKVVVSKFLLCSLNYPNMFRHPNATFRGVICFCKLLQLQSAFRVDVSYCSLGVAVCCGMRPTLDK
jgi:hypothetical protein